MCWTGASPWKSLWMNQTRCLSYLFQSQIPVLKAGWHLPDFLQNKEVDLYGLSLLECAGNLESSVSLFQWFLVLLLLCVDNVIKSKDSNSDSLRLFAIFRQLFNMLKDRAVVQFARCLCYLYLWGDPYSCNLHMVSAMIARQCPEVIEKTKRRRLMFRASMDLGVDFNVRSKDGVRMHTPCHAVFSSSCADQSYIIGTPYCLIGMYKIV